jgi:hypothetical protein
MGMVGAFFGWESVWPVLALGAFVGIVLHLAASRRRTAPAAPIAADAALPPVPIAGDEAALPPTPIAGEEAALPPAPIAGGEPTLPPAPGLRWGRLVVLIGAGLALGGLMGVAVRVGVIGGVLRTIFHGILGAGTAYYLSFLVPKRMLDGPIAQVWGLLGASVGIIIGSAGWTGLAAGTALGAGALALARRRTVEASPANTEELTAHGYLPFGVGLSIAAILLGFTGAFPRVREIFAEIAPGLGL